MAGAMRSYLKNGVSAGKSTQQGRRTFGISGDLADFLIAILFIGFSLLPLWGIVYTVSIIPPLLLMTLFVANKRGLSFWLSFTPAISIIACIIYLSIFADELYSGIWMIIASIIPYALAIPTQLIIRNQVRRPFSLWFAAVPVTVGISLTSTIARHFLISFREGDVPYIFPNAGEVITETVSVFYSKFAFMLVFSAAIGILMFIALVFLNKRKYSYDRRTV
jgi:hypothetical protein